MNSIQRVALYVDNHFWAAGIVAIVLSALSDGLLSAVLLGLLH